MIIKLAKVISCSSEHPSYPASNLLEYRSNSTWRCAQPGCMLGNVILQMLEPSCITGVDIGNYRSCVVVVSASTSAEPDNWIPIVNHQFLTHDEAADGKFRDQVEIFTKKELNSDSLKIKFDRIKITCMQSANLKELFGLAFIVFKTEVQVDLGLDVFGRFKLKKEEKNDEKDDILKDRCFNQLHSPTKKEKTGSKSWLLNKIKEQGMNNFTKRQELKTEPAKRPLLEKLEAGKAAEVFGKKQINSANSKIKQDTKESIMPIEPQIPFDETAKRTPFGDVVPSTSTKESKPIVKKDSPRQSISKKRSLSPDAKLATPGREKKRASMSKDVQPQKTVVVKKVLRKPFSKLFEGISFALSGYQNPRRDQIRRKALEMGAKYIADPNTTNNKCTHLICAVKNTPKYQQLKGHCKIVSHTFIEECFEEKKRFPWRRYALDKKDKNEPESEEEISDEPLPPNAPNIFDTETDPDSDSNY